MSRLFYPEGTGLVKLGAEDLQRFAQTLDQILVSMANSYYSAGDLRPMASENVPAGWLVCGGQAVSRTTYATLYSKLGSAYGNGDGSTTFNVPLATGRLFVGASAARARGTKGGEESVRLTQAQVGVREHSHGSYPMGANPAALYEPWGESFGWQIVNQAGMPSGASSITEKTGSDASFFGGFHSNMPPWAAVQWLIKT